MRKLAIGLLIFVMVAGCNAMPPTVVVVVTNTPDPHVLQVTVTPSGGETSTSMLPSPTVVQPASEIPTVATTEPPTPAASATPGPTATPNVFPTETRAQLYIGQEDFEHGFMFWISSIKVIWVLNTSATDPNSGTWQTYPDPFNEGQPEIDPNLTPPSPTLYQPRRGFGKLWRQAGCAGQHSWHVFHRFQLEISLPTGPSASQRTVIGQHNCVVLRDQRTYRVAVFGAGRCTVGRRWHESKHDHGFR